MRGSDKTNVDRRNVSPGPRAFISGSGYGWFENAQTGIMTRYPRGVPVTIMEPPDASGKVIALGENIFLRIPGSELLLGNN